MEDRRCEPAAVGGTSSRGANGAARSIAGRRARQAHLRVVESRSRSRLSKRSESRPASGCNTPETPQLEKTVEVAENATRAERDLLVGTSRPKRGGNVLRE